MSYMDKFCWKELEPQPSQVASEGKRIDHVYNDAKNAYEKFSGNYRHAIGYRSHVAGLEAVASGAAREKDAEIAELQDEIDLKDAAIKGMGDNLDKQVSKRDTRIKTLEEALKWAKANLPDYVNTDLINAALKGDK